MLVSLSGHLFCVRTCSGLVPGGAGGAAVDKVIRGREGAAGSRGARERILQGLPSMMTCCSRGAATPISVPLLMAPL